MAWIWISGLEWSLLLSNRESIESWKSATSLKTDVKQEKTVTLRTLLEFKQQKKTNHFGVLYADIFLSEEVTLSKCKAKQLEISSLCTDWVLYLIEFFLFHHPAIALWYLCKRHTATSLFDKCEKRCLSGKFIVSLKSLLQLINSQKKAQVSWPLLQIFLHYFKYFLLSSLFTDLQMTKAKFLKHGEIWILTWEKYYF